LGGCSHLLVEAREHRGLEPPSGWSQRIGSWCFLECNSLTYKKIIMWFSPTLGFHVKYWCTVYCVDVSIIVHYALMDVNVYDAIIY
jgi:hypothetical protein